MTQRRNADVDDVMARLDAVARRLERGEITLEQAFAESVRIQDESMRELMSRLAPPPVWDRDAVVRRINRVFSGLAVLGTGAAFVAAGAFDVRFFALMVLTCITLGSCYLGAWWLARYAKPARPVDISIGRTLLGVLVIGAAAAFFGYRAVQAALGGSIACLGRKCGATYHLATAPAEFWGWYVAHALGFTFCLAIAAMATFGLVAQVRKRL